MAIQKKMNDIKDVVNLLLAKKKDTNSESANQESSEKVNVM